mmetsp:Transcript_4271/g.7359  ORF Transcript_4271/g.7359 Transcript_4271/m.7359 type:complete len:232 (+) Transcript_4271:250-945(+)
MVHNKSYIIDIKAPRQDIRGYHRSRGSFYEFLDDVVSLLRLHVTSNTCTLVAFVRQLRMKSSGRLLCSDEDYSLTKITELEDLLNDLCFGLLGGHRNPVLSDQVDLQIHGLQEDVVRFRDLAYCKLSNLLTERRREQNFLTFEVLLLPLLIYLLQKSNAEVPKATSEHFICLVKDNTSNVVQRYFPPSHHVCHPPWRSDQNLVLYFIKVLSWYHKCIGCASAEGPHFLCSI